MAQHNLNGGKVAAFLASHERVVRVHYPGLPDHPDHALAKRQMNGFGALVSFELPDGDAARRVVDACRIFRIGPSLGGIESLISQPGNTSHHSVPLDRRRLMGISDGLVRLSVGIEAAEDLMSDLGNSAGGVMTADLVIANGTVVLPEGSTRADVVIAGERIVDVVDPGAGRASEIVDATDRIVLPGGVDPHVHMKIAFMGQPSVYDFESGGIAALCGGTTTVIDFALQRRGRGIIEGLRHRRKQADPVVTLDYGLHQIVTDVNESSLAELKQLRQEGVASLKVYMVYEEEQLKLEDGALYALMQGAADADLLIVLHAENAGIIERARAEAVRAGHFHPRFHALTRPPITEVEAVSRALLFSEDTGCPIHILHLVAEKGVDLIEQARRAGRRVTAETCTHYLALTDEAYERPDAQNYVMSPPLRSLQNQAALWEGLKSGVLSAVTSDEVSYSAAAKALGANFAEIANGCPGVQARLPVLYTLGVAEGRLTLERFAEVFATWPARIFGMGDRKGRIRKGYDADLVVIDPEQRRVMDAGCHYGDVGYTPFEGMELCGWPVLTVYRGRVVVRDGRFLGEAGQGRFIERGATDMPELA